MLDRSSLEERIKTVQTAYEQDKRRYFLTVLFSVGLTTLVFVDNNFLNHHLLILLWVVIAILFSLLVLALMTIAGFAVMRSLVEVGAGVSLLIFLAQSYCALPLRGSAGDAALTSLLLIGFMYLFYEFFNSLAKPVGELYKKLKEDKWSFYGIVTILLLLLFGALFIGAIYLVVSPIVLNLCIYK